MNIDMRSTNNKICIHCGQRHGDHYYDRNWDLRCELLRNNPNSDCFEWTGSYRDRVFFTKPNNFSKDPNAAFKARKVDIE